MLSMLASPYHIAVLCPIFPSLRYHCINSSQTTLSAHWWLCACGQQQLPSAATRDNELKCCIRHLFPDPSALFGELMNHESWSDAFCLGILSGDSNFIDSLLYTVYCDISINERSNSCETTRLCILSLSLSLSLPPSLSVKTAGGNSLLWLCTILFYYSDQW